LLYLCLCALPFWGLLCPTKRQSAKALFSLFLKKNRKNIMPNLLKSLIELGGDIANTQVAKWL
jgi:hypothetical protein